MNLLFLLCGIVTVGFVLCISVYLIFSGVPAIAKIGFRNFFFGQVWQPTATTTEPSFGILPFLLTSIYGTAGAILMGIPIGITIGTALPLRIVLTSSTAPKKSAPVRSILLTNMIFGTLYFSDWRQTCSDWG